MDTAASHAAAHQQLQVLQNALDRFSAGALAAHALSELARSQSDLLAALPAKFAEVLHQLMDRLESSALFSEESCSFSQRDLVDNLYLWADKAALRLSQQAAA